MTNTAGVERPGFRWRPWHFVLIGLLAVAAFVGVLVWGVMRITGPVVAGGDAFMTELRDGRFERAYALATPALQRELGRAEDLSGRVGLYRPLEWSWSHRSIRNGIGQVAGSAEFAGGSGRAELELHQVGGEWRVAAFRFRPGR